MSTATPTDITQLKDALYRLEWEAQQGTVDLGRYQPAYVRWGNGHPLVFLHGLGDNWPSFLLLMRAFSQDYQCIAYNQPRGFADGARLRGYRHEDLVDDLFRLLDHFQLSQATLVAHSFGTSIALRAMHRDAARFDRAVLICGFARRPLRRLERVLAWMGRFLPGSVAYFPGRVRHLQEAHSAAFAERSPEMWQYFLERTGLPRLRALAHWACVLHHLDHRPILPEIQQPVMIVAGDCDVLVPLRQQQELFSRLPNAAMFVIDRCGHFPMYSHPEILIDGMRQFLQAPACAFAHFAGALRDSGTFILSGAKRPPIEMPPPSG
jgi:pimeloyl-ACP methyl ester carboxylesterase